MIRLLGFFLLSISLPHMVFALNSTDLNADYIKQEFLYKNLCNTLQRPNVDCQCVAKSHASYSHLSPNADYADYLIESYKDKMGMPNQRLSAFERYADGRAMNDVQIEMYNAFNQYESAEPFMDEVEGCVIPNAPKVSLAPLPQASIYKEVFDYRVSSTGAKRFEQCTLTETSRVLSADELAAWHYVTFRGVNSDELLRKLNLSEAQAQEVSKRAEKKMQDYEKNERNISNYCTSLLVAEDNYGELKTRFMRTSAQRAGTPVGLKGIDTASNRPKPSNAFGAEVASIKAEIEDINAQNTKQPSAESLHNEIKNTPEYQEVKSLQNTQAANATTSLLSKGCKGAGRSDAFCSCFVESFITDIGESGGSAALPVIQDGLSNNDVMALMKSIDQSRYMQDMTKAQSISEKCESLEN